MNFLKIIKEYWFIMIFIGTLIMGWANFSAADVSANKRLESLETSHKTQEQTQNMIQVQLSQIQTDLGWIRERLRSQK
ncbi:MAG: hypothetical protein ACP5N7_05820 [Candidatus Pacearchaeota archaeon]